MRWPIPLDLGKKKRIWQEETTLFEEAQRLITNYERHQSCCHVPAAITDCSKPPAAVPVGPLAHKGISHT